MKVGSAPASLPSRPLGRTGLHVSMLGLGTVKFGRNVGVKYPRPFDLPGEESLRDVLAQAQSLGISLLDTAPAYGQSEERVGRLLIGQRDTWILCTKAGEEFDGEISTYDFSPDAIQRSVERSLSRLRTDQLDIVLLHSDGSDLEILEQSGAVETLRGLQESGVVRAIGASTKTVEGGLRAAELCDVVMASYNPWNRVEEPVLDACARHGAGVLVKKAFQSGHFARGTDPASAVEESLRFIFAHPAVSAVIVGTLDVNHLWQNCAAAIGVENH